MAIVVRHQPSGLTREKYDEVSRRMESGGDWPPDGMEVHVLFGDEGSLLVSEIWDSEEQFQEFFSKLSPVLQEVGVPVAGDPQVFDVHELQRRPSDGT